MVRRCSSIVLALSLVPAGYRLGAGCQREPIRVGGQAQETKLISRVEPVYPAEARAARLSGVVVLQVTVSESGEVGPPRSFAATGS